MPDLIDWRGDALDFSVADGGVVSMRRRDGRIVFWASDGAGGAVRLTPAEAAEVVASLVAAIALEASRSAVGGEPEATSKDQQKPDAE